MNASDFFAFLLAIGGMCLAYPVVRALAERIRPRPGLTDAKLQGELAALREDLVGEVQGMRHEIGDLAERLDFTERLLAKQRDAERLAPPGRS